MGRPCLGSSLGTHRAAGEAAQTQHAVVHDDGARGGDVEAEAGWDADDMGAARDELGGKRATLRSEDVGGRMGMVEGGQIDRLVEQLDANQLAAFPAGASTRYRRNCKMADVWAWPEVSDFAARGE